MRIILLIFIFLTCHIVTPEECIKACRIKGVKIFNNYLLGVISNSCECKKSIIENNDSGYDIKIKRLD